MEKFSYAALLGGDQTYQSRNKGRVYFHQGRVRIVAVQERSVHAEVRGSGGDPYEVEISLHSDGYISDFCTCPAHETYGACKHVYALALELDRLAEMGPEGDPYPGDVTIPTWETVLDKVSLFDSRHEAPPNGDAPGELRNLVFYLLDLSSLSKGQVATIHMAQARMGTKGDWLKPRWKDLNRQTREESSDKLLINAFLGLHAQAYYLGYINTHSIKIPIDRLNDFLPLLLETNRLFLTHSPQLPQTVPSHPYGNGLDELWHLELVGTMEEEGMSISGELVNGEQRRPLTEPVNLVNPGWIFWKDRVTRLEKSANFDWIVQLRIHGKIPVNREELSRFAERFYSLNNIPVTRFPEDLAYAVEDGKPHPKLHVYTGEGRQGLYRLMPVFHYGERAVPWDEPQQQFSNPETRTLTRRALLIEADWLENLRTTSPPPYREPYQPFWMLRTEDLFPHLRDWLQAGWEVLVENKPVKKAHAFSISVTSRKDWFEVDGKARFELEEIPLPTLLAALEKRDPFIRLSNGELGILDANTEQQLRTLARLRGGKNKAGGLQFAGARAVMLDLMLQEIPEVDWAENARPLRRKISSLSAPEPRLPDAGFQGELREYQKAGLGWLHYLRELGLGGCLADDMGLGKTIQILALLGERRSLGKGTSLVVMPKSLLFNWTQEAARFTPELRVHAHSGGKRAREAADFDGFDLILTSYQTLVRDIDWIREIPFDYAVLDESQAIKNPATACAKACNLLTARHRLTMTGTPVENRLTDLWSQLNFLNPGLFPAGAWQDHNDPAVTSLIARSVRPFLLRRTKEQVIQDLPRQIEETIYCELPASQRKLYDELKNFYRQNLNRTLGEKGLSRSKIMVLEALLRLRQTACHPGLVDAKKKNTTSAKTEVLNELLGEILESGHKALIFSQFTSMLDIVRNKLEKDRIEYAYLDGKTKDRQTCVKRFQEDPDCCVFLISLKAGGVGLNLTAAEYVIILDPWWNPATEAQAVDRAHRIGQTRRVFAYRIVARDTIEEKILSLQKEKQALADSIMTEESSLISKLTEEDLQYLLS